MATTPTAKLRLLDRVQELEHRLETLATHVKALEHHTADLDDVRKELGKLKFEVEEMREE